MSELRDQVRDKYAAAALRVTSGAGSDGCGCGERWAAVARTPRRPAR